MILLGLFRSVGIPRAWCALLAAPMIFFYAAMTGWPASAVRAIVMVLVVFAGWALKRPSDLVNSLFAAAIIILVWEPRELFQTGFQLSFFVVLCIILILPFFESVGQWVLRPNPLLPDSLRPRWQKILHPPARWTIDLFLSSTAAWLGSIPLAALYFHVFTPVSSLTNLVAVPACGLVLISNLSSLLLITWLPWVAVLFNHAGWFFMNLIRLLSEWSASQQGTCFYLPMPSFFTIALYYALLLTVLTGWLFRGRQRRWKITTAILLCAVWSGHWLWERPVTRLAILPLDGGYAAYAQGPGWPNNWLIDSGGESAADADLKPFLHAQGVNRLSHFVITHGEASYSGGAQLICDQFHPRAVYVSPMRFRSPGYNELLASFKTNSTQPSSLEPDNPIGPFTALFPEPGGRTSRAEDNTTVLRANINGLRLLLLSDLSHVGQNALLNRDTNSVRADIVIAGLPADGEPLGDAFLDFVHPLAIIIADSNFPVQRHASPELRQRLAQRNVPVFYTSEMNAVTISIRPGRWIVRAMDGTTASGAALP